ncbi:hypothetical protein [Hyalangium rubrum]|uniref:Lipoprotein n=1 Tax=Hyalangium rubrum TaxID=3103134 RepID=A0ABU5H7R6_9BACT|nr:hypothetical protein [Hyalangium sp. s54d21]MDY7229502.1 hypothetical protein [Hyalangium sp. s54d21]
MRRPNTFLTLVYAAVVLSLPVGCGGEGGEGTNPPPGDGTPQIPPDDSESRRAGESLNQLETRWKRASGTRTTGVSTTFDLSGKSMYLSTDGQAQVAAPGVLLPAPIFPNNRRYVFFTDARVGEQTGALVLEGQRIELSSGTLGAVDIQSAIARTHKPDGTAASAVELRTRENVTGSDPEFTFPADWSDAGQALFFSDAAAIQASNVTLTGFTRGVLVTPSGNIEILGSVTVASASRMYWDTAARIEVQETRVTGPSFALGGVVESGTLAPTGISPAASLPSMVKGGQATIALKPGNARSEAAFQLTQAVTEQGMLLPPAPEIAFDPQTGPVTVKTGQRVLIPVVFREKGFQGDAVLADLQVTGSGKDAVSVPLGNVEPFVGRLWKEVADSGLAAPFLAISLAPLTPFLAIGEALTCLFTTCPKAYPNWMDAGEVSRFHIIIQGKISPGTYEANVTLTGRNYEALTIPVQFTVTE